MFRKRILIEFGLPYFQHARDRIRGLYDYSQRKCPEWEFLNDPFDFFNSFKPGFVSPKKADGAFVSCYRPNQTLDILLKKGIPTVNLSLPEVDLGIPAIVVDDFALGGMAASHLNMPVISQTFYVGPDSRRSRLRLEGFEAGLRRAGKPMPFTLIESDNIQQGSAAVRLHHISTNLKKLRQERPGRLGVFAFSDSFGHALSNVSAKLGLEVPQDVAIVSCDNEELICNLSHVPLSSIPTNNEKIGFTAAERLHDLMQGKEVPSLTLIEPLPTIERLSSSHLMVDDPVVARALSIILQQANTGLRVYEIFEFLKISRRSLETRFRKAVGRSLHEEIERVRIESALAKLQADTGTNAKIALECGFSSSTHFEQAFRKQTGFSPSHFRSSVT